MNKQELSAIVATLSDSDLHDDTVIVHAEMKRIEREIHDMHAPHYDTPTNISYGMYRELVGVNFRYGIRIGLKVAPYAFTAGAVAASFVLWIMS